MQDLRPCFRMGLGAFPDWHNHGHLGTHPRSHPPASPAYLSTYLSACLPAYTRIYLPGLGGTGASYAAHAHVLHMRYIFPTSETGVGRRE